MSSVLDYRELIVWQEALVLAELVYAATCGFPGDERFGPTSRLRRAAVSVPSCIAGGNARNSTRDYLGFLPMVFGSLAGLAAQLLLAAPFGDLPDQEGGALDQKRGGVQQLRQAWKKSLERRESRCGSRSPGN